VAGFSPSIVSASYLVNGATLVLGPTSGLLTGGYTRQ